MDKFKDGRVHFRNPGMKGLKLNRCHFKIFERKETLSGIKLRETDLLFFGLLSCATGLI